LCEFYDVSRANSRTPGDC